MPIIKSCYTNIIDNISLCSIGPHSKAFEIDNIDKAGNNDIVYSGSKHKRMFIEQEKLNNENSFESCIVDINKYAQEDIKRLNKN